MMTTEAGPNEKETRLLKEPGSFPVVNALSFDIEDWFHMVEIDAVADPGTWAGFESLVERYTEWIVETVTEAGVKATFFVLGWVAERYPQLVRLMADNGHELATHSYWHRKVFELTPEEFAEDMAEEGRTEEDEVAEEMPGEDMPEEDMPEEDMPEEDECPEDDDLPLEDE